MATVDQLVAAARYYAKLRLEEQSAFHRVRARYTPSKAFKHQRAVERSNQALYDLGNVAIDLRGEPVAVDDRYAALTKHERDALDVMTALGEDQGLPTSFLQPAMCHRTVANVLMVATSLATEAKARGRREGTTTNTKDPK